MPDRCDREIAEIMARPDVQAGTAPAWLVVLGIEDWSRERAMLTQRWMLVGVNSVTGYRGEICRAASMEDAGIKRARIEEANPRVWCGITIEYE